MPRPLNMVVKTEDVVSAWQQWLQLKECPFPWDGSAYSKPNRNQGPSSDGLRLYKGPLAALIALAPSGFPTMCSLRDALIVCDERFAIFKVSAGRTRGRLTEAAFAADVWRKMCRDVYNMQKSGVVAADMKDLAKLIDLSLKSEEKPSEGQPIADKPSEEKPSEAKPIADKPSEEKPSEEKPSAGKSSEEKPSAGKSSEVKPSASEVKPFEENPLAGFEFAVFSEEEEEDVGDEDTLKRRVIELSDVEGLEWANSDDDDDDEVTIEKMFCNCPECQLPVPAASSGGQKKATKGGVEENDEEEVAEPVCKRRRIRQKTGACNAEPVKKDELPKKAKPAKEGKGTKKAKCAVGKKRSAAAPCKNPLEDEKITLPVKLVSRTTTKTRTGGTYCLQNTPKWSYVVGISSKRSEDHRKIMEVMIARIEDGTIKTPKDAKVFVDTFIERMHE